MEDPRVVLFMDLAFMAYARKASLNSTYKQRLGVVIANKSTLLSTGFNKIRHKRFGSKFRKWEGSLHAELDAMTKVHKDKLKGVDVYIYRENAFGFPVNAHPCSNCLKALEWAKVKRIYYTIDCIENHYWSCIVL